MFASSVSQDKTGLSGAIVKSNNELAKTTAAREYLTSALTDFDPDQFEGYLCCSVNIRSICLFLENKIGISYNN